jgi:ankyrin repeat protein
MARLFLKHGVPLVQFKGINCLRYSAIHAGRSAEMVQLSLDHGADPNQRQCRGENGLKPLHLHASHGDIPAIGVALRNGADINLMSHVGTPLHQAAKRRVEVMKLLLHSQ